VVSEPDTKERAWSAPPGWEAVIGLEVHAQLRTETKLFSSAPNDFGGEPNTCTTEVDLGLPGILPVLNREAVELAVRAALAMGCDIQPFSLFARKHYFYPDLPKGYQISQYEEPYALGGGVPVQLEGEVRTIALTRIHMEEDAAKSTHEGGEASRSESRVNLNRAGVPLIEIVSEPEIHSPQEAGAYFRSLRSILRYLGVSAADMEKGQLRCDANVSVRRSGQAELGTKVELKNLNSFRFVERALAFEIERQVEVLEEGGEIFQETRLWDERTGCTRVMRSKEFADDYRYFPDPDLIALRLEPSHIEKLGADLPELPHERRRRFEADLGLPAYDAQVLTEDFEIAEFFEATLRLYPKPKVVSNWVMRSVLEVIGSRGGSISDTSLTPDHLRQVLELVDQGSLTPAHGRQVLAEVAETGASAQEVVKARGFEAVSDTDELEAIAREALEANAANVEKYRAGEEKIFNFFVGQVMKRTQGKANPALVSEILTRLLRP
jgi:aspartyl-tRNA(Asn)/glutamyl-tRNA(Gln) amidotransferase subunit B